MKHVVTRLLVAAVLAGSSLLGGAQQMVKSERIEISPDPGKALVIFVRSTMVLGAYSAPVVHVDAKSADPASGTEDRLVGILSSHAKVAYQAEPGEHTFLSVAAGGTGHLVKATLDPGKTYYILVRPIWGPFAPNFSLHPLRKDPEAEFKLDSSDLAGWLKRTDFYEPTPVAQEWMNANRPSVTSKKSEALEKWKAMSDEQRRKLTLLATDTR